LHESVQNSGEHDRRYNGPREPGEYRLPGANEALVASRKMEGRSARHGQVAFDPGHVAPAIRARQGQEAHAPFIVQYKNPNKVRALIGAFSQGNPVRFHDPGGAGYAFLADHILIVDPMNPRSRRVVNPFTLWKRYDEKRKIMMKEQLERI
jgi:hypothetical protein